MRSLVATPLRITIILVLAIGVFNDWHGKKNPNIVVSGRPLQVLSRLKSRTLRKTNTKYVSTSTSITTSYGNNLRILCISIRGGADTDTDANTDANTNTNATENGNGIESGRSSTAININTINDDKSDNESDNDDSSIGDEAIRSIIKERKRNVMFTTSKTKIKNRSSSSSKSSSMNTSSSSFVNSTHFDLGEKLSFWKSETTEKAKKLFLDKITLVSTALLKSEQDAVVKNATKSLGEELSDDNNDNNSLNDDNYDDNEITLQSDLLRPGRSFHIVTTASIPWMTGTAVNPLLRAAYLCRLVKRINESEKNVVQNATHVQTTIYQTGEDLNSHVVNADVGGAADADADADTTATDSTEAAFATTNVTLVIPWLELEEDRLELYGEKYNFNSSDEQEVYIREWLRNEASMPEEADEQTGLQIIFYPARYHSGLKSIFAMGDIVSLIDDDDADVCILEEPEHLNFYRAPGLGWAKKFEFVVGIIHTNYVEYASGHYSGLWSAPAIKMMSSAMVRAYCHVVIRLSNTLQSFAQEKERTSNVHGVRAEFLEEGLRRSNSTQNNNTGQEQQTEESAAVYFIGKLLWAKGLDGILEMQSYYKKVTKQYFSIDIYGNGPDEKAIKRAFHGRNQMNDNKKINGGYSVKISDSEELGSTNEGTSNIHIPESDTGKNQTKRSRKISHHVAKLSKQFQATTQTIKSTTEYLELDLPQSLYEYRREPIPAKFPGRVDHATLKKYKVFVNPSLSEVLCTTTAEALAMGKFVIIPVHPSNHFFLQFPNCLAYRNKLEFSANLSWALKHDPEPLTAEQQRLLTWEAATDRLVAASAITRREAKERQQLGTSKLDERIEWFHHEIGTGMKGDVLRKVLGAGPAADQVKYSKRQSFDDSLAADENAEGLSIKFVGSFLANSIRKTFANGILAPAGVINSN